MSTEAFIYKQQEEMREIIRQKRLERKRQSEDFYANSILDGKISVRQAFLKMFPSPSGNPKTAVSQYVHYIAKLFEAYKGGAESKEVLRHMAYATYEAEKHATQLHEEYVVRKTCDHAQDKEDYIKDPYYANYNDMSKMDKNEIKDLYIKKMEELISDTFTALDRKYTPQVVVNCEAINDLTGLTASFLGQEI